jgi:hypothetical protein
MVHETLEETLAAVDRITEGPSHDEIADRAFRIFEARGGHDGQDREDWLQAEAELLVERSREINGR